LNSDNNLFNLLRDKEIISILDGDKKFEKYKFKDGNAQEISMPYLSGPDLCELSTKFGLPVYYSWSGEAKSRWEYLDDLLKYCIKNKKCSNLLSYMFSLEQFKESLKGHDSEEVKNAHKMIVETIIKKINGILFFGGNELTVVGDRFIVHPINSKTKIVAPKIENIDREYITSISARAMEDVEQGNFDSAITKSRTLLEETFCYVIEKKNEEPEKSGNINQLYKQVRDLYRMNMDPKEDKRIKTLLSGLNSIVSAIAEMRNNNSDAHGVGAKRIKIAEHHARLCVNAAMTMADFIISVYEKQI
jgi:hypothetical protein